MEDLKRVHRWQLAIGLLGTLLVLSILGLASLNYTTVLVPARGGVYHEAVVGSPRFVNPLLASFNLVDEELVSLVFRGLARFDEQGRVVPELAADWKVSPDARVFLVRLRPGFQWQDGIPVTIQDVLFTYRALQSPDFPGPPAVVKVWRDVTIEQVDAWTVQFTLPEPFAPFLDELTRALLPAHRWESIPLSAMPESALNWQPVGNGPFVLESLNPSRAILVPNSLYPGPSPYLEQVYLHFYPNDAAAIAAYRRGEVDAMAHVTLRYISEVQSLPDVRLFFSPMPGYTAVLFNFQNPNVPFFQDRRVRQALLYAIDREAIVRDQLRGMGLVAHSLFLPGTWAYAEDGPRYPYDPDRARALLAEAGWEDRDGDGIREKDGRPLRFILLGDDDPTRVSVLQALVRYWRAVGVDAVPQSITFATLVNDFLVPRRFEAALVAWQLRGDPDPYPLWHSTQVEGGQNYSGWQNADADHLMEAARQTADEAKRRALYRDFQRLFAQEVPALLLYHPVEGFAVRSTTKNVRVGTWQQPGDRYRTIAQWYIRERRVPVAVVTPTPVASEEKSP